jgi:hypothetical protein
VAAAIACSGSGTTAQWLTMPTAAQHDKFFPIARGPHATDCNACHGTSDTFKGYECIGCHTQLQTTPFHTGVATYRWDSPSCYSCHPRGVGTMSPADHAAYFPIASGQSHELAGPAVTGCTDCHVQIGTPDIDCTACHRQAGGGTPAPAVPADQTTAHSGKVGTVPANLWLGTGSVGTGAGESAKCLKCHAGDTRQGGFVATHGQASAATGHAVFPIASGGHFVSCDQCHTATLTDPKRKNAEFDFTRSSCDICHAASGTASVIDDHTAFGVPIQGTYTAGDPNNASACLTCHQTGQSAGNFAHKWFPIGSGDVHNSSVTKCADCHSTPASYQGPPAGNLALITCTKCHDDSAANVQFQNGVTITAAHSAPRVGRNIWDVPGGMNYADTTLCLRCHAGNIGGNVAGFSTPLVFRLSQHDTHCSLSGKPIAGADRTHAVDRNADNGVNTCFACHNVTLGTGDTPWAADWITGPPPTTPVSCAACHEHATGAPRVTCR